LRKKGNDRIEFNFTHLFFFKREFYLLKK